MDSTAPIDAVYTWVNGADPAFRAQLERYRDSNATDRHTHAPTRFWDNQELRFSLRSIERYAPWIRHVFVVTNGQVPDWLDLGNPRLTLLDHKAIFPDCSVLPIFNSRAIEWRLRAIEGLSTQFLYFNDDFFLGRALAREDLMTRAGGKRIFLEPLEIPSMVRCMHNTDRADAFTCALLDARFGASAARKKIAHVPYLWDQNILREVENIWGEKITRMSTHRFRHPEDVSVQVLHDYYSLQAPAWRNSSEMVEVEEHPSPLYAFVALFNPKRVVKLLSKLAQMRPKFFCLNDDMDHGSRVGNWMVRALVRAFLLRYFPGASSFEK